MIGSSGFKSLFTKESEDQTDEQPHHKKGRYQRDVGQDGRDPPSLIVVIFHNKGVVVVIPGISLNWTSRTTVPPLGAIVINLAIFIEFCRTPGLHRFLDFHLYLKYFHLHLLIHQLPNVNQGIFHFLRHSI